MHWWYGSFLDHGSEGGWIASEYVIVATTVVLLIFGAMALIGHIAGNELVSLTSSISSPLTPGP